MFEIDHTFKLSDFRMLALLLYLLGLDLLSGTEVNLVVLSRTFTLYTNKIREDSGNNTRVNTKYLGTTSLNRTESFDPYE